MLQRRDRSIVTRLIGYCVVLVWLISPVGVLAQDAAESAGKSEGDTKPTAEERLAAEKEARQARIEERKAEALERRERKDRLRKAVAKLKAEAKQLDQYKSPTVPPVFKRPHPAINAMNSGDAIAVLGHMTSGFTGNKYLDTYINWHLIKVVQQGKQSDREEMGRQLIKLVQSMPGSISIPMKTEYTHEPPEAHREWAKRYYSLRKVTGYPPYQKYVNPPASLELMNAAERAQANKTWAEALEWRKKFETIYDKEAKAFNDRIRFMNHALREYRGELIYEILRTGDPAMLELVVSTMDRQAKAKTGIQFDLLNYMYLAAFDGVLNLYSKEDLKKAGTALEKSARAHEAWVVYGRVKRNYADYAFHMVHMLRDGEGFIDPRELKDDDSRKKRRRRLSF